jgi:hypothetical protein
VEHRHLLPNEIDLLLDGDGGFGLTPLKAHVRQCAQCRSELEEARALTAALEHLPHFAPSPLFAEQVMAQVQVFEPAHVTAIDTARRWLPRTRPARVLAGAAAGSAALVLSFATLWVLARLDVVLFLTNLVAERSRGALLGAVGGTVGAAFGQPALEALRPSGADGLAVALTALLVAVAVAAVGLRAMIGVAARSRRSS